MTKKTLDEHAERVRLVREHLPYPNQIISTDWRVSTDEVFDAYEAEREAREGAVRLLATRVEQCTYYEARVRELEARLERERAGTRDALVRTTRAWAKAYGARAKRGPLATGRADDPPTVYGPGPTVPDTVYSGARRQVDQWSIGERAIRDAMLAVESMGADVRLTDAVVLLGDARERVADFVDGIVRPKGGPSAEARVRELEVKLARLREAASAYLTPRSVADYDVLDRALRAALAEPGPTLASIRAEALRDAARLLDTRDAWHGGCEDIDRVPDWLRGRADEIEKEGGRG